MVVGVGVTLGVGVIVLVGTGVGLTFGGRVGVGVTLPVMVGFVGLIIIVAFWIIFVNTLVFVSTTMAVVELIETVVLIFAPLATGVNVILARSKIPFGGLFLSSGSSPCARVILHVVTQVSVWLLLVFCITLFKIVEEVTSPFRANLLLSNIISTWIAPTGVVPLSANTLNVTVSPVYTLEEEGSKYNLAVPALVVRILTPRRVRKTTNGRMRSTANISRSLVLSLIIFSLNFQYFTF